MFITLTPLRWEEPVRLFPRLKRRLISRLRPPRPEIHRVELYGRYFMDIRAPAHGGIFDEGWQGPGRQSCRFVLCPHGYDLPPGCLYAVSREDCRRLTARVMCNTALHILELSGLPLYSRRLGLIDPDCAYPFLLKELIQQSPDILVYTQNHALYQGYADKIMEEYGAPVTFTDNISSLRQTRLILHGGTQGAGLLYPLPILCIRRPEEGGMLVEEPVFSLPEADDALPPGIDPLEFYAALYERCAVRRVSRLIATSASCKGRNVTPRDIARQIQINQKNFAVAGR